MPTTRSISREKSTVGTGAVELLPTMRRQIADQSAVSRMARRTDVGIWLFAFR